MVGLYQMDVMIKNASLQNASCDIHFVGHQFHSPQDDTKWIKMASPSLPINFEGMLIPLNEMDKISIDRISFSKCSCFFRCFIFWKFENNIRQIKRSKNRSNKNESNRKTTKFYKQNSSTTSQKKINKCNKKDQSHVFQMCFFFVPVCFPATFGIPPTPMIYQGYQGGQNKASCFPC